MQQTKMGKEKGIGKKIRYYSKQLKSLNISREIRGISKSDKCDIICNKVSHKLSVNVNLLFFFPMAV